MEKIEIGRCKDCGWYDNDDPMLESTCMNPELWDIIGVEYPVAVWLFPDGDFGCIHWKEKEGGN